MVKKVKIETTPTPSESEESEQETEEVEVLEKVATGKSDKSRASSKKSKTLDMDDLKNSVLSLVKGAIKYEEVEQPKPKQKRKVSEEVLKRLELAREKRKKNHEEHKEEVAKMLLKQKGYNISKYDEEKPVSKPTSVSAVKTNPSVKKEVYEVKKFDSIEEKKQEPVYQTTKIPLKSTTSAGIITTSTPKTTLPTIKPTQPPRKFNSMFE